MTAITTLKFIDRPYLRYFAVLKCQEVEQPGLSTGNSAEHDEAERPFLR